ncbi:MAG: hypothetical protein COZ11_00160 [Deltaproteobacteria bacterium CG_4_10_14_3_um_filter_51_14]|nr:MAG: hypothetical protein COZ11_00160 [Deltaproteobacteria bacterium CG_4_10_14_3_um_filter_51_14]
MKLIVVAAQAAIKFVVPGFRIEPGMICGISMLLCTATGHRGLYENPPSLHSSPSTGEGGVGVIFIFR